MRPHFVRLFSWWILRFRITRTGQDNWGINTRVWPEASLKNSRTLLLTPLVFTTLLWNQFRWTRTWRSLGTCLKDGGNGDKVGGATGSRAGVGFAVRIPFRPLPPSPLLSSRLLSSQLLWAVQGTRRKILRNWRGLRLRNSRVTE